MQGCNHRPLEVLHHRGDRMTAHEPSLRYRRCEFEKTLDISSSSKCLVARSGEHTRPYVGSACVEFREHLCQGLSCGHIEGVKRRVVNSNNSGPLPELV